MTAKRNHFLLILCLFSTTVRAFGEDETAILLAGEVERLAERRDLWPGFEPLTIPLAIYDGDRTFLFRHPSPPDGFVALDGELQQIHAFEGRHPAMTANSNTDIGETMTATLVLEGVNSDRTLTDLAAVALHEAFHVFQREQHPDWQANEADLFIYPTTEASVLAQRRLETVAFRRALEESEPTKSACWARQALVLRGERFARMDEAFTAYERGTELNEGLAAYVQQRAEGSETVDLPVGGFQATEVRRRAYSTGSALALLLDRFQPEWQISFETDDEQNLDQALQSALGVSGLDSPDRCTFSDIEIAEADRIAHNDTEKVLARRVERRAEFEARSGWRAIVQAADGSPLWPQGFDPLNVETVEDGVLHLRFLRAGNDYGYLEVLNTPESNIETLTEGVGPHPLFNGIRRVVIAGLAKPEVSVNGKLVSVQGAGLDASFEAASVHQELGELVVTLEPRQ